MKKKKTLFSSVVCGQLKNIFKKISKKRSNPKSSHRSHNFLFCGSHFTFFWGPKMATAVENVEFTSWLDMKLKELKTDETVFGSYIRGILDGDDSSEEKSETLEGILAEILENGTDITKICHEILEKWQSLKPKESLALETSSDNLNDKLARLLESQSLATTKQKEYTEEEKKIRQAILSQYGQMTDSEEDDEEGGSGETKDNNLEKNVNAQLVADAEKQKREQFRLDSQKKKEKDKEDREKQKQLKEDKKEKRKTQKGERKR